MYRIRLTKGRFALVDDQDALWLAQHRWCFSSDGYATNYYRDEHGRYHRRSMHRLVMARLLGHPPKLRPSNRSTLDTTRGDTCVLHTLSLHRNMPKSAYEDVRSNWERG